MRRKVCLILSLVFVLSLIFQVAVLASDVMPLNNNTNLTRTSFVISDGGEASISLNYEGYPNITTGATITVKIEKRNFLLFWIDVIEEIITVNDSRYYTELHYQLEDTGTYRCTVVYTVSGTGGADDVLTFEETKTYG